jgi:predicted metalloprotease with PDZ domain
MRRLSIWLIATLSSLTVIAQHIRYEFAAPNAVHHEAEISVTADGLTSAPALFRMSRSSPGRYATHEFGKNVYNVKAYDEAGKILKIEKAEGDVYKIYGHKGTVKVTYTLFANYADGTYANVDITGYHLNIPASFMWVKGLEKAPITLHFTTLNNNWKIATQLKPTADPLTFTAPDLQYFMDSPTKVGDLHWREWKVTNPANKQFTFRLALEADATETAVDAFTEKLKNVVAEGQAVYGEFPDYDYGTYTFIASINPYVHSDGMEHRNSTMITIPRVFDGSDRLLSVFAHEFFHCWNVERIRPKSIEPFNFEKANMSEALWVAEGFTHYYGDVLLVRAGLLSYDQFQFENSKLVNAKMNTPGAKLYTPIENSQRAVFTDAGVSVDRTNYPNMFTSYYPYGGSIALSLDLELRTRFNKSMDDVMRELWKKHGKTEKPYVLDDVQNAIATVTNNKAYAANFFTTYVYHPGMFDYNKLYAPFNYSVQPAEQGEAWLGDVEFITSTDNRVIVNSNTIRNTPLYNAGVDFGDAIMQLDGNALSSDTVISNILSAHKPGDEIKLTYSHRNNIVERTVVLKQNPRLQIVTKNTGTLTKEQETLRSNWMAAKRKQ